MIRVDSIQKNERFNEIANVTFAQLGLSGDAYVEVDFVSKEEMRSINFKTRNVDRATDVLSFPALTEIKPFTKENYPYERNENGEVMLGSILICLDVAKSQAEEYGHSFLRETCYLFTHGLMHLLGYDHEEEQDATVMRKTEEMVLCAVGIKREE